MYSILINSIIQGKAFIIFLRFIFHLGCFSEAYRHLIICLFVMPICVLNFNISLFMLLIKRFDSLCNTRSNCPKLTVNVRVSEDKNWIWNSDIIFYEVEYYFRSIKMKSISFPFEFIFWRYRKHHKNRCFYLIPHWADIQYIRSSNCHKWILNMGDITCNLISMLWN